ncbi:P-loop NTPase fold protein, partial [Porphyromonas sp.]|uniref:KAP family P-loop NTPase fold protein n=1 Tax=Porphyromonas sp. TaxID=1924944 RepID=UPI001CAB2C6E
MDNSIRGYEVECPCTSEDEDLLGRGNEAQDLAEKIFQTDTSNAAFTIGLTAPWGAGKTSFMLAMQKYLRDNHCSEIILLDFNPWMYRKAPNLTQIFFEELSRALAPYNSALASGFTRYVDHILDKDDSAWLQLGVRLLPQGFKAKSTREQYEFLKKEIDRLGRKIMIFIDDVDRLDSEELIELFSLIRNSSLSFPNMSYILTYDKEYVASQLQNKFDAHTYRYMEKILQEEYLLAKITPEQLEEALRLELKRIGYGDLWRDIKNSGLQLSHHLPTLRVIKRICNTLSSRRKELESNVALFDWFIIELIRIQYPRLFDFLRENYSRVFDILENKRAIRTNDSKGDKSSWMQEALSDHPIYGDRINFSKYIFEHHKDLQIKHVGLVMELLVTLWGGDRD